MRMSVDQWRRLDVVERIERGEMTIAEGATALGLSTRQMKRVRKRVRRLREEGVVHGNTGRVPANKTPSDIAKTVLDLRRTRYTGFNDEHFTEKLVEVERIPLSRATVRRILRKGDVAAVRGRRAPKHRRRRDRRAQAGQMILWDGSRHDWLEGRGPILCLIGAIDDATGELLPGAHFVEQEGTVGYLRVLREIVTTKGVPLAAYMDRHSALKRNDKNWTKREQLAGQQDPTQVKRALDDLGVQVLYALSPQAKGRVERLWGTLQDRLTSELRLVSAATAADADRVLEEYRPRHNRRFAVPSQDVNEAWRPALPKEAADGVCALQFIRRVANNNTVRVGGVVIDLEKQKGRRRTYAHADVIVRHELDGRYCVYFNGELVGQRQSSPPVLSTGQPRTVETYRRQRRVRRWRAEDLDTWLSASFSSR
jgi:hypothetical protein